MVATAGTIGKFYDVEQSRAIAMLPDIGVDENEMSATALITTPEWDRQKDSVNPMGGCFKNYRKNPVVFFDHGQDIPDPIACSDNTDKRLCLFPSEAGIVAKSFFSNRNKLSEQMFFLVADRIMRGTSIRFNPTAQPIRKSRGTRFEAWTLEEWSWTGLGVNPGAVGGVDCERITELVSKGRIAGSSIHGGIMKSLRSVARQTSPRGTRIDKTANGTRTTANGGMLPPSLSKSLERIMTTRLLGQQVMESAHGQLTGMSDKLKSSLTFVENPGVVSVMKSVNEGIDKLTVMIEGGHQESYKKSLKACDKEDPKTKMLADEEHMKSYSDEDRQRLEDDDEFLKSQVAAYAESSEDDDETKMKSFLTASPADRFVVSGIVARLDELSADDSAPEHVRSQLKSAVSGISSIIKSALEKPGAKPETDGDEQSVMKSMKAEIAELTQQLQDSMPCSR